MKHHAKVFLAMMFGFWYVSPGFCNALEFHKQSESGAFVTVFGSRIHYVQSSNDQDADTVILLHGLADDVSIWNAQIGALGKQQRVIALDQIGFGASDKPMLNYRVGTFVDFLDGFVRALHIKHFSLVGHSLGGWVAVAYTIQHPDSVNRLVLIDSAGWSSLAQSMSPKILRALRLATRDDIRHLDSLAFFDPKYRSTGIQLDEAFAHRITTGDSYAIGKFMETMVNGDDVIDNDVSAIKQSTLIIWGKDDRLIPSTYAARFKETLAHAQVALIDKCEHMPQIEAPEKLNDLPIKFLAASQ